MGDRGNACCNRGCFGGCFGGCTGGCSEHSSCGRMEDTREDMFDQDYMNYCDRERKPEFLKRAKMPSVDTSRNRSKELVGYIVKEDECLDDILETFQMTITEFLECNHTRHITLTPGKAIYVYNRNSMD